MSNQVVILTLRTWPKVPRKAVQNGKMVTSQKRNTEANLQQKPNPDLFLWIYKLFKLAEA